MPELSILIPSRNEEFLRETIEDIFKNIEADTEVIALLDGQWSVTPVPDHPKLTLIYLPESIGQRAGTNLACKLSRAKYVMKADAHCAFDKGFDRKMIEAFEREGENCTMVPEMRNLHAFDWVCANGHRRYQSPSGECKECGLPTIKDIIFAPKKATPHSTSYCFDSEPHFQYFNEWKKHQHGDIVETMSLQGSCFMLTREKYWELNICDEAFGTWGSQGIEVALKTWLSGGRVLCNRNTWYAHMFRTQGGDFGFPYPLSGRQVQNAKRLAKDLFFNNKFEKQIYPLSWLLEKFWPVYGWTQEAFDIIKEAGKNFTPMEKKPSIGIIYYTDNRAPVKIAKTVQKQLLRISKQRNIPIVSCSLKPMPNFGKNIVLPLERGHLTMFKQILTVLEASDADIIFHCEHDNLMHPSHFDFIPPEKDKFYYDRSWWKVRSDGLAVHWDADQVSGLCAYRETLIKWYQERIRTFDAGSFDRKYEPNSGTGSEWWKSEFPSIDIRHTRNLTYNKWTLDHFRDKATAVGFEESTVDRIPGWKLTIEGLYGVD